MKKYVVLSIIVTNARKTADGIIASSGVASSIIYEDEKKFQEDIVDLTIFNMNEAYSKRLPLVVYVIETETKSKEPARVVGELIMDYRNEKAVINGSGIMEPIVKEIHGLAEKQVKELKKKKKKSE